MAKSLSVGPGIKRTEFGANMGSMVRDGQRDRALGLITRAEEQGARIAARGRKRNRPGAFLEPTVLSGVTPDMDIAQQDVFGPVLSVLSCREDAHAIEIANSTDYGLVGGVFTADLDRATALPDTCVPVRSSSTNGTQAASKRLSAATENPAMAAKKGVRRLGTTGKPRTSRSG